MIRLLVATEGAAAEEHLVTLPVDLGRDPEQVDVVLADRMVSRRHARLEADGDAVMLVDLDSANGTQVNGAAVSRRAIGLDDVVAIGGHTLRWGPVAPPSPTPDLGSAWVVALDDTGLHFLPLAELYAAWQQLAERVAGLAASTASRDRLRAALDTLLDTDLDRLAPVLLSCCAPETDVASFRSAVGRLRARPAHAAAQAATDGALEGDRRAVREVAEALGEGVRAFEEHGADVVRLGGDQLLDALRHVLDAVAARDDRLAAREAVEA